MDTSRTARLVAGSPVTIHEGAWAYCPAGSRTDHAWKAIELWRFELTRAREDRLISDLDGGWPHRRARYGLTITTPTIP